MVGKTVMLVDEDFPLAVGLVRKERPSVILIELKKVLAGKKFISSDVLDSLDEKSIIVKKNQVQIINDKIIRNDF